MMSSRLIFGMAHCQPPPPHVMHVAVTDKREGPRLASCRSNLEALTMNSALLTIVVALLCSSCVAQDREHHLYEMMKTTINGVFNSSRMLEEILTRLNTVEEILTRLNTVEEILTRLNTVEEKLAACQECAKREQLADFLTTSETDFQEIKSSIKQCADKEQIRDFQELLVTEKLAVCQECAKREQLADFLTTTETDFQEIKSSIKQCADKEQIRDFQELLVTDECTDASHSCSEMAICKDSAVNYTCTCLPGYTGDGFNCLDIDECSSTVDTKPCAANEVCLNTRGSYECSCSRDGFHMYAGKCQVVCESPSFLVEDYGCITLIEIEMDWYAAEKNCRNKGQRLLEDLKEQDIKRLRKLLTLFMGLYRPTWIGFKEQRWLTSKTMVLAVGDKRPEMSCGYFNMYNEASLGFKEFQCSSDLFYSFCQSFDQ